MVAPPRLALNAAQWVSVGRVVIDRSQRMGQRLRGAERGTFVQVAMAQCAAQSAIAALGPLGRWPSCGGGATPEMRSGEMGKAGCGAPGGEEMNALLLDGAFALI